jgi:hypothetical protein
VLRLPKSCRRTFRVAQTVASCELAKLRLRSAEGDENQVCRTHQGYNFSVDNVVRREIIERVSDLRESFIEVSCDFENTESFRGSI